MLRRPFTGRELHERLARYAEDQRPRAGGAQAREWHQLTLAQQIGWEDLATWINGQVVEASEATK